AATAERAYEVGGRDARVGVHVVNSDIGEAWADGAPTGAAVDAPEHAAVGGTTSSRVEGGRRLRIDGQGASGEGQAGGAPGAAVVGTLEDAARNDRVADTGRIEIGRRQRVNGHDGVGPDRQACGDPGAAPISTFVNAVGTPTRVERG